METLSQKARRLRISQSEICRALGVAKASVSRAMDDRLHDRIRKYLDSEEMKFRKMILEEEPK